MVGAISDLLKNKADPMAENAILRQQLVVLGKPHKLFGEKSKVLDVVYSSKSAQNAKSISENFRAFT
jgi:hypothetical protein